MTLLTDAARTTAPYGVPLCMLLLVLLTVASILVSSIPPQLTIQGVPVLDRVVPGGDDSADQLVWVLHVSDIHLDQSVPERTAQLVRFCNETVRTVQPALVLATGDLTDGPDAALRQTSQVESEWQDYRRVLREHGMDDPAFWLDLRGNHDAYGVPSLNASQNMYRTYGVHGGQHHYTVEYPMAYGGYRFVSLDLALDPGMLKPWTFFAASPGDIDPVVQAIASPTLSNGQPVNHTFVLGHFPMATSSSRVPWRSMAPYVTAYFCGHLHTLGMYRRMWAGYLELEVEDLKSHKAYRLLAIDHDLVSFVDVYLDQWPLALVTNPKNSQFLSAKEPVGLIALSTHLRVLAFSPAGILKVNVTIEGAEYNLLPASVGSPVFVAPWNPAAFAPGLHQLSVQVTDGDGNVVTQTQSFSVDGTAESIPYTTATMISGFPTSVFVDVLQGVMYVYFIGLLFWFPRIIAFSYRWRVLEKMTALVADSPGPVLVNDNDDADSPAISNSNYGGGRIFTFYKDIDNRSAYGQFITSWNSHMRTVATLSWARGWGFIAFFSLILVCGPMLIIERLDGVHWGVAFSWGVMTPDGFTAAVESQIMGIIVLLGILAPSAQLFVEWERDDPDVRPVFCFAVSVTMQIIVLLQVIVFVPAYSWLTSPFGFPYTVAFLAQCLYSFGKVRQRRRQGYDTI